MALTPDGVQRLKSEGHSILLENGAGELAGFLDSDYRRSGAQISPSPGKIWKETDLILKVKEPQPSEFKWFSSNKILFCYLHLAVNPRLTRALLKSGITAIAGETVQEQSERLPLLEPMSEIAGRMAAIVGSYYQAKPQGGRGVLVSGLPGVLPAHLVIIGGGTVGENAAKIASGMGAQVTILDTRQERLRILDEILPKNVSTLISTPENIQEAISSADIIIGSVLIPGAKAPKLITKKMLKKVPAGCVLVDVSIDQGGVAETSRPTTHSHPTYFVDGILHYCVSNMPGAFGRTASLALTGTMLSYLLKIAHEGLENSLRTDPGFALGLNIYKGNVVCKQVAEAQRLPYTPWEELF